VLGAACPGSTACAQDTETIAVENARLRAENRRLRAELDELRRETARAAANVRAHEDPEAERTRKSPAAGTTTTQAAPSAARGAESASTPATTVEAEYLPMSRVSLSVSRDASGSITSLATPWHRSVDDSGLLPIREFVQLRSTPARGGDPPRVWLGIYRQGVQRTLASDTTGHLRIGDSTTSAPLVEHEITRRRRHRRTGAPSPLRDEIAVFSLPFGSLHEVATAARTSFTAGPIRFTFTDDHVSAAAALSARLRRDDLRRGDR